jgi:hypothetical protein
MKPSVLTERAGYGTLEYCKAAEYGEAQIAVACWQQRLFSEGSVSLIVVN